VDLFGDDDEYDRYDDEYEDPEEFQRQPLQERRRHGSAAAAAAGFRACGGLSVVDAAGAGLHSGRGGIM
jgi:hypothetical protein